MPESRTALKTIVPQITSETTYTGTIYTGRIGLSWQLADIWKHDRLWVGVILLGVALVLGSGVSALCLM